MGTVFSAGGRTVRRPTAYNSGPAVGGYPVTESGFLPFFGKEAVSWDWAIPGKPGCVKMHYLGRAEDGTLQGVPSGPTGLSYDYEKCTNGKTRIRYPKCTDPADEMTAEGLPCTSSPFWHKATGPGALDELGDELAARAAVLMTIADAEKAAGIGTKKKKAAGTLARPVVARAGSPWLLWVLLAAGGVWLLTR